MAPTGWRGLRNLFVTVRLSMRSVVLAWMLTSKPRGTSRPHLFLELSWIRTKRRSHAPLVPWPFGETYGDGSAVFLRRVLRRIASSINVSAQSYSRPSQNAPRHTIGLVIP